MTRTKSIKTTSQQVVTHQELQALMSHVGTLMAAYDVRLQACEAALPVDPQVKADADEFVRSRNHPGIMLVPDGRTSAGLDVDEDHA